MLTGQSAESVCKYLGNERETTLSEMKRYLFEHGITMLPERRQAFSRDDLPSCALLSLETPRCWHWSLYADGVFYDPEHGVSEDFPRAERKYYWEILTDKILNQETFDD